MKKVLSVFLAFVMLLSVMAMSVSAQSKDISDEIFNVIKLDVGGVEITKDDVNFEYIKKLSSEKYLVRYTVNGFSYPSDYVYMDIGVYIFGSSRPLPELYFMGKLWDIDEAYDKGWLTVKDLELMDTFTELNFGKTKVAHKLDEQSRHGDPDEYVYANFIVQGSEKTMYDFKVDGMSYSEAFEKQREFFVEIHNKLINETLKDYDPIEISCSFGVSVAGIKRKDVAKIAQDDFVVYMGYVSDLYAKFLLTGVQSYGGVFKELCYGYDENGEESYVLLEAYQKSGSEANISFRLGEVVIHSENIYGGFSDYKYAVFDIKEDKFYDIYSLKDVPDKYYGLQENLAKYAETAFPVGDSDGDKAITIMDATKIQRVLAQKDRPLWCDHYVSHVGGTVEDGNLGYISDFDYDGNVTVLDATAIQLHLAQVD